MRMLDRFQGCLIGGAVGDALGYAVEFLTWEDIRARYGPNGIAAYALCEDKALISDDTQMTLFTANGLLYAQTRARTHGAMLSLQECLHRAYLDWLDTQRGGGKRPPAVSWLRNLPELHSPRAPGGTCLSALESGRYGTADTPINQSKGCGGIMRVAPVGLFFDEAHAPELVVQMGADAAALTHGHELGWLPAAGFVHMVRRLAYGPECSIPDLTEETIRLLRQSYENRVHLEELVVLLRQALELAEGGLDDVEAISRLGGGWVAEETLAIAVYCCAKYPDDFGKAVAASVNHSGDSDSTGAVTGNLMGARLGLGAIPPRWLDRLELKDTILDLASDLFETGSRSGENPILDGVWKRKYIDCIYPGS